MNHQDSLIANVKLHILFPMRVLVSWIIAWMLQMSSQINLFPCHVLTRNKITQTPTIVPMYHQSDYLSYKAVGISADFIQ